VDVAVPLAGTVLAAGISYLSCVRPMRQHRHGVSREGAGNRRRLHAGFDAGRAELARLRADDPDR